jgi:hypothetical protein
MEEPYKLLVEGKNDKAVIIHLMKRHGYDWDVKTAPRAKVKDVHLAGQNQSPGGGVENLLSALGSHL